MSEFRDTVNELVGKMEQGDDGKWALPEEVAKDLDEPTLFAVTAERRVRDTQSSYTKSRQELKQQQAIAESLQEKILNSDISLTKEQKFELNELKKSNPDKWRAKLNEYEEQGKASIASELDEIRANSANKGELEVRKEQMAAWSESTGIKLDDDVIANDLPPRFIKKLEAGECTFEEFLEEVGEFIQTPKVIVGADEDVDDKTKSLSQAPGGKEPSKEAQKGDFVETYEHDTIF